MQQLPQQSQHHQVIQQSQPELLFTSCSSISSPSSPMSLTLSSPAIITQSSGNISAANNSGMGSKRGRLLIRQQRVKKDGDQTGDLETPEAGIYSEYLLSVPSSSSGAKMERHASEPSPATSSGLIASMSSGNLLTVPTHSSYLIKQHSHPLLPSQQSLSSSTSYTLTRQLSQPIQTTSQIVSVTATSTTHGAQDIAASGQLLQFHHQKHPVVRSHTMPHYTVTDMELGETTKIQSTITSSPTVVIIPDMHHNEPSSHAQQSSQQHSNLAQSQMHQQYQKSSSHHLQLPSIRVKSEELQRSVSSPLVKLLKIFYINIFYCIFIKKFRHQHEVNYHLKINRAQVIVPHFGQDQHLAVTFVGIQLMLTEGFCDERQNITVPNAKRIYA